MSIIYLFYEFIFCVLTYKIFLKNTTTKSMRLVATLSFLAGYVLSTTIKGIDYTTTCGSPNCNEYYDGCNTCYCDPDSQLMGCTEMTCTLQQTPYCKLGQCDNSYWLSFDSFQSPGSISVNYLSSFIFR